MGQLSYLPIMEAHQVFCEQAGWRVTNRVGNSIRVCANLTNSSTRTKTAANFLPLAAIASLAANGVFTVVYATC